MFHWRGPACLTNRLLCEASYVDLVAMGATCGAIAGVPVVVIMKSDAEVKKLEERMVAQLGDQCVATHEVNTITSELFSESRSRFKVR